MPERQGSAIHDGEMVASRRIKRSSKFNLYLRIEGAFIWWPLRDD